MKWTEEQLRQVIVEETNKFLDEPYDQSFDLVLLEDASIGTGLAAAKARRAAAARKAAVAKNMAAANQAGQMTPAQTQAAQAAAAGGGGGGAAGNAQSAAAPDDEPLPNVLPTWRQKLGKAGTAVKKFATDPRTKKAASAIAKGAGGLAKGALGAVGQGVGAALGGLAKGAIGAFQSKGPMAKIAKAAKKAEKAGLDKATILQLAKLYQSGALGEKQIATLKLVEKCSKSDKIQIIKENEENIIIDV